MNEYTTDIRDLDTLPLGKVAGSHYYEQRLILCVAPDGTRSIVGKASDWPLIKLQAENAELTWLLTVSEERSIDADCHVAELMNRISAYEQHIAALETALAETQPPPQLPATAVNEAEQAFVTAAAPAHACPSCEKTFKTVKALSGHRAKVHGAYKQLAPEKAPVALENEIAPIALAEPPWKCANPACSHAFARSVAQPDLCIRCVVESTDHMLTNGHLVAA